MTPRGFQRGVAALLDGRTAERNVADLTGQFRSSKFQLATQDVAAFELSFTD